MNINQIEAALSVPDTSLRCQRVLNEVQPILHQIMDAFKNQYAHHEPELLNYHIHTYEATLRTTMHDARNPKYADSKRNSDIGKKAFIELLDRSQYPAEFSALMLSFNGMDRKFKITQSDSFYPYWEAVRTQSNAKQFAQVLESLPENIQLYISDNEDTPIRRSELIPFLQTCVKEKRRPEIVFGTQIDFERVPNTANLVEIIWNIWNELEPLRLFRRAEAARQAHSHAIFEQFNAHQEGVQIALFGKVYDVKFEGTAKVKASQWKQEFGLYEKGQLLVQGSFDQYLREPNEVIGIRFNHANGVIFSQLRMLQGEGQVQWLITKSFKTRGNDSSVDLNKVYLNKAMEELKNHQVAIDGNTFYVGTWDNDKQQFVEPIAEVKKTMITAAAIFTDCLGYFHFPKEVASAEMQRQEQEEADENFESFEHDFDLSAILSIVRESPFTYDDEIIRDFHLNLVSLEDKHFVILNGISGTGKTRLCLLYANAVYGKSHDELNPYLRVIPVRPDWTDSTALFGYYSALEKRYVRTPFLNAVLQAIQEGKPMFIVLDEMNLARVEYYLSDYLSAIESRQPIRLHTESHITDVPQELQIPHNLYVIGTINVDETTHSISDKVLDRAFVMTLSDVDLEKFWKAAESKYQAALQEEWNLLQELHVMLSHYELHFGYRTMNEMLRKLYTNAELGSNIRMEKKVAVDRVIAEKVLPKIRGDERIDALLTDLINWTATSFGDESKSLHHLKRMKGELDRYGSTQFWR